jgi:hypothetical protein
MKKKTYLDTDDARRILWPSPVHPVLVIVVVVVMGGVRT